jgi:hypothetical protein
MKSTQIIKNCITATVNTLIGLLIIWFVYGWFDESTGE